MASRQYKPREETSPRVEPQRTSPRGVHERGSQSPAQRQGTSPRGVPERGSQSPARRQETSPRAVPQRNSQPAAEFPPGPGVLFGTAQPSSVGTPDPLMVLFLGEITNSQLAINNGTVTQTMMKGLSESHRASTAQAPLEPESNSLPRKSSLPSEPPWKSMSTETAGNRNERLISAKALCRKQVLRALDDLLAQLGQLGLSTGAQQDIRRAVAELQLELTRTPVNMARVHAAITQIRAQLAGKPQESGCSPAASRA